METHPGEGVVKEKFPNTKKTSHQWVCGEFWNHRGQHDQELKQTNKQTNTEYVPNRKPHWRSSPDACVHQQQAGAEQGDMGCIA